MNVLIEHGEGSMAHHQLSDISDGTIDLILNAFEVLRDEDMIASDTRNKDQRDIELTSDRPAVSNVSSSLASFDSSFMLFRR